MPNYGTYAICPYFQSEDSLRIKCEGIIQLNKANTEFVLRFSSGNMKKEWLKTYCETYQYGKCPYSCLVEQQWDEPGKSIKKIAKQYLKALSPEKPRKKSKVINIEGQLSLKL